MQDIAKHNFKGILTSECGKTYTIVDLGVYRYFNVPLTSYSFNNMGPVAIEKGACQYSVDARIVVPSNDSFCEGNRYSLNNVDTFKFGSDFPQNKFCFILSAAEINIVGSNFIGHIYLEYSSQESKADTSSQECVDEYKSYLSEKMNNVLEPVTVDVPKKQVQYNRFDFWDPT